MKARRFLLGFLVVSLLIAGVGSFYASSHPDGLEFVAEKTGFSQTAESSPVAGSPLEDYNVSGVDNERISGGLAGIIGALVVLTLSTGLFAVVRRRRTDTNPTA